MAKRIEVAHIVKPKIKRKGVHAKKKKKKKKKNKKTKQKTKS